MAEHALADWIPEADVAMCIGLLFSSPPNQRRGPAIFLDRDGLINEQIYGGYVTDWPSFMFVPGIREALAALTTLGVPLIVVSNQAAVEKGLLSRRALGEITARFVEILAQTGARIDAAYYCPHQPSTGCLCRKPKPGLLQRAARDWSLDLRASVMVGDGPADIEAAAAAACKSILFCRSGTPNLHPAPSLMVHSPEELYSAVSTALLGC